MFYRIHSEVRFLAQNDPGPPGAPTGSPNPFDGVQPDLGVWGEAFNSTWKTLLGGVWGIAFLIVAFGFIRATVELQRAKKGGYSADVHEHTESAKKSVFALIALAGLGMIFGAVIAIF
ncbi:hypothetical protein DFR72_1011168 [Lentzea flaviverrucosa]|uniref:Interferon-induced transmembrane protein n=1 Tax=Lentzea flaviverrucosa TaxID=200379 RepID=A0A1H9ET18_9PSEU|nr:hypothetical protein DFR72_1011168 [Lentzea flaviverrucosa]SEQ28148.1 hypothetical protein SAMN05216195_10249 [Lentzea flaviverrucosa]